MHIPGYCVKNPVTAIVINLAILIVGIFALLTLPVRATPSFEPNNVRVQATLVGSSAELMESNVADVLENYLSSVQGVANTTSTSSQGVTSIKMELSPGTDRNEAMNEMRTAVSQAMGDLPDGMDMPVVQQFNDSDSVVSFVAYWPGHSLMEAMDYTQLTIKPLFSAVQGVGDMDIGGVGDRVMSITLKPEQMAARNIGSDMIAQAIVASNISLPAGQVRSQWMNYPTTLDTRLSTPEDFRSVLLKKTGNTQTNVGDVANVELGQSLSYSQKFSFNGKPALYVEVDSEPSGSLIQTYQWVMGKYTELKSKLPKSFVLNPFWKEVESLIASIHEVFFSIFFSMICVLIVVYLSLGRLRQVWVPAIAIPISLMGALFVMKLAGVSINIFTLLALVLAVGLVVDDAIVVLENTQRHLLMGRSRKEAAILGGNEIASPVIVMTLTLLIVYIPIGFVSGKFANLYLQFAVTLAAAVLVSGVVSLTLSPLMCATTLPTNETKFQRLIEKVFTGVSARYRRGLACILNHQWWAVLVLLVFVAGGGLLFTKMAHEIAPTEESGFFIVYSSLPAGSNQSATEAKNSRIVKALRTIYPHANMGSLAGRNNDDTTGITFVTAQDMASSHFKKDLPKIQALLNNIPGGSTRALIPSRYQHSMDSPISFYLTSTDSYQDLSKVSQMVKKKMAALPGVMMPSSNLLFNSQEYNVKVNTPLANDLGISNQSINGALNATFSEDKVSKFIYKNQLFNVVMRGPVEFRNNIASLNKIQMVDSTGSLVPLSQLVDVQSILAQPELIHYNRLRAAQMGGILKPGFPLSQVAAELNDNLPKWLPTGVSYAFRGGLKQLSDASGNMALIFGLALICIYFALSIQFKNFLDPLAILLTVPLCMVGALFALWLEGGTINLYTTIALVTLVGLVSKHGILLVQFANQQLENTGSLTEAVLAAAEVRLRPILMTTAAMVVGVLPLVFAMGSGSASRTQIGITIVGGLIFGTFFSLVVVPIAYRLLARLRGIS
jgi:hydrophobe/amphiphile efflux-1 (HAE1) family protein